MVLAHVIVSAIVWLLVCYPRHKMFVWIVCYQPQDVCVEQWREPCWGTNCNQTPPHIFTSGRSIFCLTNNFSFLYIIYSFGFLFFFFFFCCLASNCRSRLPHRSVYDFWTWFVSYICLVACLFDLFLAVPRQLYRFTCHWEITARNRQITTRNRQITARNFVADNRQEPTDNRQELCVR